MKTRHSQSGSVLAFVLMGLVVVGALSTLAYSTYFQIARGTQDTAMRAQSSLLLTQAAYALASEASDTDADGIAEPTVGLVAHSTGEGWNVPATSGAPKTDAWGTTIKYCPWDNGATNASVGRFTGVSSALPASIQLIVISAGPDKTFNTTCVQAVAGIVNGDDGTRTLTVTQMNLAVGGAWVPVNAVVAVSGVVAAATCATYPLGTLGRGGTDQLFMCATGFVWKYIGG
ncbi:MAG: hypothetical protein RIR18_2256 [Pseudomonadota bacterium]|jgi:hypothetical protein